MGLLVMLGPLYLVWKISLVIICPRTEQGLEK